MESPPKPAANAIPTAEAAGAVVAAVLLSGLELLESRGRAWGLASHLALLLMMVAWARAAGVAARRRGGWERRGWRWFAAAGWLLAAQVALAAGLSLVAPDLAGQIGNREATPSLAYPVLIVGFLLLARRAGRHVTLVRALDAVLVAGGTFFVLWSAVYRDLFDGSPLELDERLEVMSYPALGAALVATVWLVLGRSQLRSPAYRLVAIAATLPWLTDVAGSVLELRGAPEGELVGDLGFLAAILLWFLASRLASRDGPAPEPAPQSASRIENYLPLAVLGLAVLTAVQTVREHGAISQLQFWLAAVLIGVLLVRMGVTLSENMGLQRRQAVLLDERTRMLRFISHELANPISPLALHLHLLRQASLDPQHVDRSLGVMERSVRRLRRLSDDVRTLVLAEQGTLKVDRVAGDLADLARKAVQASQEEAATRKLELVVEAPDRLPCWMDGERIGQVLDNLLSNALKFTPEGGRVVVRVSTDGPWCRVEVQDNGRGLTPQQVQDLFGAFKRFHPGVASGLGLGLNLSRALAKAHDGRLEASSDGPDKGATFRLELPAGEPGAPAATATPAPVPAPTP